MYAGFWKRFLAYLIDFIILYVSTRFVSMVMLIIVGFASFFNVRTILDWGTNGDYRCVGIFMITFWIVSFIVLGWLYSAIMESCKCKATVGKLSFGIVVVDEHNQKLSFGRASARYMSGYINIFTVFVGFIMAAFTARKQALHDLIARTYVVDKRELDYILREQTERGTGM
ncbi:RDD family protein [Paenibacillus jamilae]|uniref:RDD family protein n=1 Tax=Paenibacillus jamilae TaxID=114136 RepID=UPI003D2DD9D7